MNPFLDKESHIEITSRNLPHWHQEGKMQFVTFHLADSIPKDSLTELKHRREIWLSNNPTPWTPQQIADFRRMFNERVDKWLDAGFGCCVLRDVGLAQIIASTLEYFDGEKYDLINYVVMPNHVHVLVRVYEGNKIHELCKSWKGYSARLINKRLNRMGTLWHSESWDRIIRNEAHLKNVMEYIKKNVNNGGVLWKI